MKVLIDHPQKPSLGFTFGLGSEGEVVVYQLSPDSKHEGDAVLVTLWSVAMDTGGHVARRWQWEVVRAQTWTTDTCTQTISVQSNHKNNSL